MRRIASVGAYVPRLSLSTETYADAWGHGGPRGIEQTTVPDADEDSLTLAAEAATRALSAADVDPGDVAFLAIATTTPPTDEEAIAPRLASLVGVPALTPTRQYGGSTRAGVAALVTTMETKTEGPALVVAADCPRGTPESTEEAAAGAGSGAVVVAGDGSLGVDAVGEYTDAVPGTRFRRRGSETTESLGIAAYGREAYRSAVARAVDALDDADGVAAVDAAALTAPNGRLPFRAAGALGLSTAVVSAGTVVSKTGDTGAAGPFLGLATALTAGAESVLLVGYGSGGGAIALLVSSEGSVPVEAVLDTDIDLTYPAALRRRGVITGTAPEGGGAYVSVPSWQQTLPQRHRLVAGRCRACGELAFPPDGACHDCGSLSGYDDVRLPGVGTVEAITVIGQGGAPPEFVEQQQRAGAFPVAVVAFDGTEEDESVSAPAQVVDSPVGAPEIGDRVVAVPRRIYEQEGVVRYGFKVLPARAQR